MRPPQPKQPARKSSSRSNRWLGRGVIVLLLVTAALEIRDLWTKPWSQETLRANVNNEVLLEATPVGQVKVISEVDGQHLGTAPLRFLVPEGPELAVLLHAPDRTPVRQVLPAAGRVTVHLQPSVSTTPKCVLNLPAVSYWRYQTTTGEKPSVQAQLQIQGSTVVYLVPEGQGAWLVQCGPNGKPIPEHLDPIQRRPVDINITSPTGALVFIGDSPMGKIPQSWSQTHLFAQLRLRLVGGSYIMRWIAAPNSLSVELPISDDFAPRISIPNSQTPTAAPSYAFPSSILSQ
ncbi:MAG: hypothetical protein KTR25_21130 [Myxococcales bacterium]|nr:hypothetical protein [Myxococcales bacterium]